MAQNKTHTLKKAMLLSLEQSLGIVTTAAKAAGIERRRHYEWYNKDPQYKAAVDGLSDVALDFVESKLHMLIKSGNPASTIFYLKTKGRGRGYIERQEIEVTEKTAFILKDSDAGAKKVMDVIHKKTGTNDKRN